MRHWPEWLFIALVVVLPFAAALARSPETFLGFLAWLGLGMLVGAALWIAIIWLVCLVHNCSSSGRS